MNKKKNNDTEMVEIEILKGEYTGGLCICINGLRICGCADKHYEVVQTWRIKRSRLFEDLDIDDWVEKRFIERKKARKIIAGLLKKIATNISDILEVKK